LNEVVGQLSSPVMFIIDVAAWLCINLGVSGIVSRFSADSFNPGSWLYRVRGWEQKGRVYDGILRVKTWKRWLPDGAAVSRRAFRKKHLLNSDSGYLQTFLQETCRAEVLHWIIFLFCPVFFIWNQWYVGIIMIAYAAISNMPCIITQRYNRARLARVLASSTATR
jgi:glycosyl-4,4'-diaponeurosporenoate acyltransferase